jgi:hypothetical protein
MESKVGVTYECYRAVIAQNMRLKEELESEKAAHTDTKARIVFANHILYGNREDKVNLFKNEYTELVEDLKNKISKLENYYNF